MNFDLTSFQMTENLMILVRLSGAFTMSQLGADVLGSISRDDKIVNVLVQVVEFLPTLGFTHDRIDVSVIWNSLLFFPKLVLN